MIEKLRTFALATILISYCHAGSSQVANGDFDEELKGWNTSKNAIIDTAIYKTKEATGEGGINKSLKITSSIAKGWDMAVQNIDVEPGATYQVELWIKLLDAKQTHAKIEWLDKNNKFIKNSFICPGTDGNKDWFKATQVVQAPDKAVKARLVFLAGKGTSWFDAVTFVKTNSPIPQIEQEEWANAVKEKYGPQMTASEMKEKIIYYDMRHDCSWVSNTEPLLAFFNSRGFTIKNADGLRVWMQKKIKEGADGTVCIMAMGTVPDNIIESISTECTLKKYMDAGGRIVWIGDIPLYYTSYIDRIGHSEWSLKPRKFILGIKDGKSDINKKTEITETGKSWRMKHKERPLRTLTPQSATLIFSETTDNAYACSYFKNYNIKFPYSGFLRYRACGYDGSDKEQNEDLYSLALYRGKMVVTPEVREVKKIVKEALKVTTDFMNYPRGKNILISISAANSINGNVNMVLKDKDKKIHETTSPFRAGTHYVIETKDLASGEYSIEVQIVDGKKTVAQSETKVSVVPVKMPKFPIGMFGVMVGTNEYKLKVVLNDLKEHLGECGVISGGNHELINDLALKYGLKVMPKSHAYYKNLPTREQNTELHMKVSTEKWPTYHYNGFTNAPLCFGNTINRENVGNFLKKEIKEVYKYPAFMNVMLFDDDVAMYGDPGEHRLACYCENCKSRFKKLTEAEAPVSPAADVLKNKGLVKDNDPWYRWMKFRTKSVYGDWNKAMEDAKNSLDPTIKLMPAIGGWEVFSPQWGLNPPDTFRDLEIVSFYHYPQLSRPCIYFMSQAALGMMGNRNKEYWGIPQSSDYADVIKNSFAQKMLVRNEFYYLIAVGSKGMVYFHYPLMPGTEAWEEFKNLSKFGTDFAPLILNWEKTQPTTAILTSYCNASYQWAESGTHYKISEELYISHLKEHVATDMMADEEILAGDLKKYKILLLTDIDYLTESVYKKIEEFIQKGGTVFCDKDSFLKFPGSKVSDRNSWVAELKNINGNPIEIDTPDLIFSEFASSRASYLMLVNARTDKASTGKLTLKGIKGKAIYDISEGKLLNPKSTMNSLAFWKDDDALESEITVDTAGGKLIGIYPAAVADISILSPKDMTRGKKSSVTIEIKDKDAKNIQALFPVKVTIIKPDGKVSEYSDFYAAPDGKLELQILPAVNDMPGKWEIEIRELSSGRAVGKSFTLE